MLKVPEIEGNNRTPRQAKALFILLIGLLSMVFAEVFAGSSPLWFVTPWSILVTFPLYLAHILLFLNLALIFRRTSISSLYIWGILFALYETWITKVLWAGFSSNSYTIWGSVGGFGIYEFGIIGLFWHPLMSFIVPLLIFQIMAASSMPSKGVLGSILPLVIKNRRNWFLAIFMTVTGASFLSAGSGYNFVVTDLTILVSVLVVYIVYKIILSNYANYFSFYSLKLGRMGFAILGIYLAGLYIGSFLFILPSRIAALPTIFLTIVVYVTVIVLQFRTKQVKEEFIVYPKTRIFRLKDFAYMLVVFVTLGTIMSLIPQFGYATFFVINPSLVIAGYAIFVFVLFGLAKRSKN